LREPSCRASEEAFVAALTGNYRHEHLFALRQAVELFDVYQAKIEACDAELASALADVEARRPAAAAASQPHSRRRRKNQLHFDARPLLQQIAGVDLAAISGFDTSTALTILSETGADMSPWPSGKHFSAWLALSPNNRITGGKPRRRSDLPHRPSSERNADWAPSSAE
jgi:transposase